MSKLNSALISVALVSVFSSLSPLKVLAQEKEVKPAVKIETKSAVPAPVLSLLKLSMEAYGKMKTYRHTAVWSVYAKRDDGQIIQEELKFTLALERPNRFAYKIETVPKLFSQVAAFSDGKTFVNFKGDRKQYTKSPAPQNFKGINIVDDVEFQPIGTYLIALMLQGDILADKDIRTAMEHASLKSQLVENGKKWQILEMPFGDDENPYQIYVGIEDHLIGKAFQMGKVKISETIEAIRIDKPIEPTVFSYTLPESAKQIEKFVAPSRPNDA